MKILIAGAEEATLELSVIEEPVRLQNAFKETKNLMMIMTMELKSQGYIKPKCHQRNGFNMLSKNNGGNS